MESEGSSRCKCTCCFEDFQARGKKFVVRVEPQEQEIGRFPRRFGRRQITLWRISASVHIQLVFSPSHGVQSRGERWGRVHKEVFSSDP